MPCPGPLPRHTAETGPARWGLKTRKALTVGISTYRCPQMHDLQGCHRDAELLGSVLTEHFDFETVTLTQSQARRGAIIDGLTALLESCRPGDEVLFFFSGHGSRIDSRSAGPIETLVPYDSHRPKPGDAPCGPHLDITDRELYAWALHVSERGAHPTFVLDACLGGGMMRDLAVQPKGVRPDHRLGTLANKTAFLILDGDPSPATPKAGVKRRGRRTWLPPSDRYTLFAACQVDQFCREMLDPKTEQHHGILTLYLAEALRTLQDVVSWRELRDRLAPHIEAQNPSQQPQIEGAIDRQVFGARTLRPRPFAEVLGQTADEIHFNQGAAHGVVLGSRWQLHMATARRAEGLPLATVEVTAVDATTARARRTDDATLGPVKGLRAFEVHRPFERRVRIFLAPPQTPAAAEPRAAFAQTLDATALLTRVHNAEDADFIVGLEPPSQEWRAADTPPSDEPAPLHWQVLTPDGAPAAAPRPVSPTRQPRPGRAGSTDTSDRHTMASVAVVSDLEKLARHRFLLSLKHPKPELSLARHVDAQLLTWPQQTPIESGRGTRLGQRLALRLRRRPEFDSTENLYVAVLDLGLSGAVHLIYPRRRQRVMWTRSELEIGFHDHDAMVLELPQNYPLEGSFERQTETLLVVLTRSFTDLDPLTQSGVGPWRSAGSPVTGILEYALGLPVHRSGSTDLLGDPEHWGLIACPFDIIA